MNTRPYKIYLYLYYQSEYWLLGFINIWMRIEGPDRKKGVVVGGLGLRFQICRVKPSREKIREEKWKEKNGKRERTDWEWEAKTDCFNEEHQAEEEEEDEWGEGSISISFGATAFLRRSVSVRQRSSPFFSRVGFPQRYSCHSCIVQLVTRENSPKLSI